MDIGLVISGSPAGLTDFVQAISQSRTYMMYASLDLAVTTDKLAAAAVAGMAWRAN